MASPYTEDDYRLAARCLFEEEGVIEFDDTPYVSESDGGAYVACYRWVANDDVAQVLLQLSREEN